MQLAKFVKKLLWFKPFLTFPFLCDLGCSVIHQFKTKVNSHS